MHMKTPLWKWIVTIVLLLLSTARAQWVQNSPWHALWVSDMIMVNGTVFAASTGGGVFRSMNNGVTWESANNGIIGRDVITVVNVGTTAFALEQYGNFYRSSDNGDSWTEVGYDFIVSSETRLSPGGRLGPLTCHGDYFYSASVLDSTLFVAGCSGLHCSTDLGDTWSKADGPGMDTIGFQSVAVAGEAVFAQEWCGERLFRSMDKGETWTIINSEVAPVGMRAATSLENSIYLITARKIFRSDDNGTSWKGLSTAGMLPDSLSSEYYNYSLTVISAIGGTLYLGTSPAGAFRSFDKGETWERVEGLPEDQISCFAGDDGFIFTATVSTESLFRSADNGATWAVSIEGITDLIIDHLVADGNCIVAGAECGDVYISTDNGATWIMVKSRVDPVAISGSTILFGVSGGSFYSNDYGYNWKQVDLGDAYSEVRRYVAFEALAVNGTSMFGADAHGSGVLRSTDNGTTWQESIDAFEGAIITSLAADGATVLAGTDGGGIFRSTDNGETWTLTSAQTLQWVSRSLVVSGSTVIAQLTDGRVYLSNDGGAAWKYLNPTMPFETWNRGSIVIFDTLLFAGFPAGDASSASAVHISRDNGDSWTSIDEGLGSWDVRSLAMTGTTLFAGTGGNGIWRRPLTEVVGIRSRNPRDAAGKRVRQGNVTIANKSSRITLSFTLGCREKVTATLYRIEGSRVMDIVDAVLEIGYHTCRLDPHELTPGCYTMVFRAGNTVLARVIPVIH